MIVAVVINLLIFVLKYSIIVSNDVCYFMHTKLVRHLQFFNNRPRAVSIGERAHACVCVRVRADVILL